MFIFSLNKSDHFKLSIYRLPILLYCRSEKQFIRIEIDSAGIHNSGHGNLNSACWQEATCRVVFFLLFPRQRRFSTQSCASSSMSQIQLLLLTSWALTQKWSWYNFTERFIHRQSFSREKPKAMLDIKNCKWHRAGSLQHHFLFLSDNWIVLAALLLLQASNLILKFLLFNHRSFPLCLNCCSMK